MLRLVVSFVFVLVFCPSAFAEHSNNFGLKNYFEMGPAQAAISSERNKDFQNLIDETYEELLNTPFGKEIVRKILNCSPELLAKHLGISQVYSFQIANTVCTTPTTRKNHPWIYTIPDSDGLEKVVSLRQKNQRTYTLILTDNKELGLDSWTDFRSQTTTVYLPENSDVHYLRYRLLFVLAHETAIYFDQKSQLTGMLWAEHSEFRSMIADSRKNPGAENSMEKFLTAANNPLISQVLSYIRAFRVETLWLKELPDSAWRGKLQAAKMELSQVEYDFVERNCDSQCLARYIKVASERLLPYTLPLLANSRYWSMKLAEIGSLPPSEKGRDIRSVLIDFKSYYVSMSATSTNVLSVPNDPDFLAISETTSRVFSDILIPEDLSTLEDSLLYKPPMHMKQGLVFLTTPSLGNFGVELASGPRPRIRTGSSFQIDMKDMVVFGSDMSMAELFLSNLYLMELLLNGKPGSPLTFEPSHDNEKQKPFSIEILPGGDND